MSETIRCDLCNSTDGVDWTWVTPCTASSAEEAATVGGFWAEDPHWAVCDICHKLITVGERRVLLARSIFAQRNVILTMFSGDPATLQMHHDEMRDHVRKVHDIFWTFKTTFWRN